MRFLIRWIISAVSIFVAVMLVPGIDLISPGAPGWITLLILAFILGLLNAILRPLIMLLTCPLIILTLGLGTLLVNTFIFALAGWIGAQFGVGFTVDGFWPAFLGALVVSIVSFILNMFVRDDHRR